MNKFFKLLKVMRAVSLLVVSVLRSLVLTVSLIRSLVLTSALTVMINNYGGIAYFVEDLSSTEIYVSTSCGGVALKPMI